MEARGMVIRLADGSAWVRVDAREQGCGRCDEPGGCRSAKLTHLFRAPVAEFSLPNDIQARPGQQVRIVIADRAPLRAALLAYALPTLLLIGGVAMVTALGGGDALAALGAVGGLVLGWGINRAVVRMPSFMLSPRLVPGGLERTGGSCRGDE